MGDTLWTITLEKKRIILGQFTIKVQVLKREDRKTQMIK